MALDYFFESHDILSWNRFNDRSDLPLCAAQLPEGYRGVARLHNWPSRWNTSRWPVHTGSRTWCMTLSTPCPCSCPCIRCRQGKTVRCLCTWRSWQCMKSFRIPWPVSIRVPASLRRRPWCRCRRLISSPGHTYSLLPALANCGLYQTSCCRLRWPTHKHWPCSPFGPVTEQGLPCRRSAQSFTMLHSLRLCSEGGPTPLSRRVQQKLAPANKSSSTKAYFHQTQSTQDMKRRTCQSKNSC